MINQYMLKRSGIFHFFFLLFLLSACSHSRQADYKDRSNKIASLYEQAKYDEALVSCDKFIDKYSKSPFGYGMKGVILNVTNRSKEALDSFNKQLLYLNPNDHKVRALAYEQLGQTYINLNDFETAVNYFKKAQEEDSDLFSTTMLDIARVYLLKGDVVRATTAYVEAKGKLDVSNQGLQQINKRNKGNVYNKAAFIAFQLHKDSESLDYAMKYNEVQDSNQSKFDLANYLVLMGLIDKSKQLFSIVNLDNVNSLDLAEYYLQIGDIQHSIDSLNKSYEQQKTPEQVLAWKMKMQRKWPRDVWKTARSEEWFSRMVYK
jgi:tetratricopeptide (TPR) repeat protein